MNYRIYIDETGTCSMSRPSDENNRYLGLTGIILKEDYARTVVAPAVRAIKEDFFSDQSVIFHRKEMLCKEGSFCVLENPTVCGRFDVELLSMINSLEYCVVTAIIDKKEHLEKYEVWQAEPYHYCMEVLLERYHWFLRSKNAVGDVMIESRSKKQDKKLKNSYTHYYKHGNRYLKPQDIQKRLTSKEIKIRPKSANIVGLQLADLIAHPSALYAKALRENRGALPATFGGKIAKILHDEKYYRSNSGKILGYGVKWLP